VAAHPGWARPSPVNRPKAETATCITGSKYQKNTGRVKNSGLRRIGAAPRERRLARRCSKPEPT